jgi:hypothetical protein
MCFSKVLILWYNVFFKSVCCLKIHQNNFLFLTSAHQNYRKTLKNSINLMSFQGIYTFETLLEIHFQIDINQITF